MTKSLLGSLRLLVATAALCFVAALPVSLEFTRQALGGLL